MSIHGSAMGTKGYETVGKLIRGEKWRRYRFVTLCPSGTGAAEGRSFVDANGGGTAFVRLVVSIVLEKQARLGRTRQGVQFSNETSLSEQAGKQVRLFWGKRMRRPCVR